MMFKNKTTMKTKKPDRKIRIRESELESKQIESMLLGAGFGMGVSLLISFGAKMVKSNKPKDEYKGSMECLCR